MSALDHVIEYYKMLERATPQCDTAEQAAEELAAFRAVADAAPTMFELLERAYDDFASHAPECVKYMDYEAELECDCGLWEWQRVIEKMQKDKDLAAALDKLGGDK